MVRILKMEWDRLTGKLTGVSANGVFGVELVRYVAMVFSRVAFANSGLHEPGQRWQDVDWRIDAFVV